MPIGIQRLNDRHPQPSSQIVFIKPLQGPDYGKSRHMFVPMRMSSDVKLVSPLLFLLVKSSH